MYEGRWKGRPVALKVCYCVEITPERIEQIVAEGAALGVIRHENVIEVRARWWWLRAVTADWCGEGLAFMHACHCAGVRHRGRATGGMPRDGAGSALATRDAE